MTETFDVGRIPPQLRESLLHGKAAAEIGWCRDGDFDSCRRFLRAHGVPGHMIDGECAELHKEACGFWPGRGRSHEHAAANGGCDHYCYDMDWIVAAMGAYQPITWDGPLARVGEPTGDRRYFPPKVMQFQSLPMPLRWQPYSELGHKGAITVGTIDSIDEREFDGKTYIWGKGHFLNPDVIPEVHKAVHQVEEGVAGPSVDLDSYSATLALHDVSGKQLETLRQGRTRAATLVAIPAFADLRLKLTYPQEGGDNRPFDLAPEGADTANLASTATFAVNPDGWKSAPVAPREALFDADDAVKRIQEWAGGDAAKMSSAFLWIADTQNGPLLGREGYRLPWGDIIEGKPYLVYHAAYAAAALLEGAHGGLPNIPDSDKAKLRNVLTEIYAKLSSHFDDPSIRPSWAPDTQAQASADTEELAGRYTESKHPRDPRHDKHAGEWVDVPGHGPHGQILDKATGKMVYPDKKTGKLPEHHEAEHHEKKKPAKVTAHRAAPKKDASPPEEKKVVARHEAERKAHEDRAKKSPKDLSDKEIAADIEHHETKSARHGVNAQTAKKNQRPEEAKSEQAKSDAAHKRVQELHAEQQRRAESAKPAEATKHPLTHEGVLAAHQESEGHGKGDSKLVSLVQIRRRLGGSHEEQTALLKRLDRERKIQLDPEPNQKILTPEIRSAGVPVGSKNMLYLSVPKREESKKHVATPQGIQEPASKKPAAKVAVRNKPAHKLTPAQEKYLREGSGHPASRKVLEREGYLDADGKLTDKGRQATGQTEPKKVVPEVVKVQGTPQEVEEWKKLSPEEQKALVKKLAEEELKRRAKVAVRKSGPHKVSASQRSTLEKLHAGGPLAVDAKREGVHPASVKVLEREGYVERKDGSLHLTDKGRSEIGAHVPAVQGHTVEKPAAKVAVRRSNVDTGAVVNKVRALESEKDLGPLLEGLSRQDLVDVAKGVGAPHKSNATKVEIKQAIHYQTQIRIGSHVLSGNSRGGKSSAWSDEPDRPWYERLKGDTGPEGIPVSHTFAFNYGDQQYPVASGRVYQLDGVKYLVEGDGNHAGIVRQLKELHESFGPDAGKYVRSYSWLRGRKPGEQETIKRLGLSENMTALATNLGSGDIHFWQRGSQISPIERKEVKETIHHELGHSLSHGHGDVGHSAAWQGAAASESKLRPLTQVWFDSFSNPVTFRPDPKMRFPHGVTSYGKADPEEDFAEAVMLYSAGRIGTATTTRGREVPIYFRDVFPDRAKILDRLLPHVAQRQEKELAGRFIGAEKLARS